MFEKCSGAALTREFRGLAAWRFDITAEPGPRIIRFTKFNP
jgi:hypothetical protein